MTEQTTMTTAAIKQAQPQDSTTEAKVFQPNFSSLSSVFKAFFLSHSAVRRNIRNKTNVEISIKTISVNAKD